MKLYVKFKDTHRLANTPCYNKMEILNKQLETFQIGRLLLSNSSLLNWQDLNLSMNKL